MEVTHLPARGVGQRLRQLGRCIRHAALGRREPLCDPAGARDALFPIPAGEVELFNLFREAKELDWSPINSGVDFSHERESWGAIDEASRKFLIGLLAFFVVSDGVIADNVAENFTKEFTNRSIKFFFDFQASMENTHSWTYSLMLDKAVPDSLKEKVSMYTASTDWERFPHIAAKRAWLKRYTNRWVPLQERLVAFACAEGIGFSSAFAGMFWIREQYPGRFNALTTFNTYIMKDENMHTRAGCLYHNSLQNRCSAAVAHEIIDEAVQLEIAFMNAIITDDAIGLCRDEMAQYVRYIADILCGMLVDDNGAALPPLYNAKNPYKWMLMQSLRGKANFFEYHESEYTKSTPKDDDNGRSSPTTVFNYNEDI